MTFLRVNLAMCVLTSIAIESSRTSTCLVECIEDNRFMIPLVFATLILAPAGVKVNQGIEFYM